MIATRVAASLNVLFDCAVVLLPVVVLLAVVVSGYCSEDME